MSMRSISILLAIVVSAAGCASPTPQPHGGAVPVNQICPVTNDAVDPQLTTSFEGQTVGFCCSDCPSEWEQMSTEQKRAALAKVMGVPAPAAKASEEHHHGGH